MKAKMTMILEAEFEIKPHNYSGIEGLDPNNLQDCLNWQVLYVADFPYESLDNFEWEFKGIKGELVKEAPHE